LIIIINDDDAYLAWLEAHPRGYVVNAHRRPKPRYLVLHRTGCTEISAARRAHWTTGPYIKVCSRHVEELVAWARDDVGGALRPCERCRPKLPTAMAAEPAREADHPHLTKMGDHLLSYILELAVMSLDGMGHYCENPPTVGKLAKYFERTVGQVTPVLRRLLEDGYISVGPDAAPENRFSYKSVIYPTAASLRTVPAFAELNDREVAAAIATLLRDERSRQGEI
jgi:hypothetical protein